MNLSDDNIEELYQQIWTLTSQLLLSNSPVAIAAVLSAQAMTIYRTTLTEDEYESIAYTIYNSRDRVKKLESPVLQ